LKPCFQNFGEGGIELQERSVGKSWEKRQKEEEALIGWPGKKTVEKGENFRYLLPKGKELAPELWEFGVVEKKQTC